MSVVVKWNKIVNYLRNVFPLLNFTNEMTNCPIEIYDIEYVIPNQSIISDVIYKIRDYFNKWDIKYKKEIWDCDDFARLFAQLFNLFSNTNSCFSVGGRIDAYPIENSGIFPIDLVLGYHGYNILFFSKTKEEKLSAYLEGRCIKIDEIDKNEIYITVIEPQITKFVKNITDLDDMFLEVHKLFNFNVFGYEIDINKKKYLIVYHTEKVEI